MPNIEAATVAETLCREFIARYGAPLSIHTDQGTQFTSELFQHLCETLCIEKMRTTTYRPQSDGQAERNIKTIVTMLATIVKEQTEWDIYAPYVGMAYRAHVHESTGFSPNYLMFGREAFMPLDLMILVGISKGKEVHQFVEELREVLREAYAAAGQKLKQAAQKEKRLYDRKAYGPGFEKGDAVWMANKGRKPGRSPKFMPKWRGPCLITQKFNDVLMEVQSGSGKTAVVHTDLLKPYRGLKQPRWMKIKLKLLKTC